MEACRVVIVTYQGVQSLDVAGPLEVFAGAGRAATACGGDGSYLVQVASVGGGMVRSESGLSLGSEELRDIQGPLGLLVLPGGGGVDEACRDEELRHEVTRLASETSRLATVCSGTLLAAACGLLEGRRVTTHWSRATQLAAEHPRIEVDADAIYIHDGDVWTSAGVTTGIDLALALVEHDLGADVAQLVARWLVMFLHRPGGQSQFSPPIWTPRAERPSVRQAQELVDASPGAEHSVTSLARAAAMSPRHFARVFATEVGETPARYVESVRIDAARRELETSEDTVEVIAERLGFGTAETMRRSFQRRLHVSPDDYRQRFCTSVANSQPTTKEQ